MVTKSDLIFQQWVTSLPTRTKTRDAVSANFDELFSSLRREGLVLESAYEYLPKAIKAHEPTASLIRNVFKKIKTKGSTMNEKEFAESWCKDIADKANVSFFEHFPVEVKEEEEPEDPIVHGSMTAKEYKAQRKHANEYPRLDTADLEKRFSAENYNPVADISALVGSKLGNTD